MKKSPCVTDQSYTRRWIYAAKGTEEIWVIYIGIFRAFCVLCQPMSYMHVS